MKSLDGITDSMDMSLSKPLELAFPAHLRMWPVSAGNSRRATWVGPHAERPRFPGPRGFHTQLDEGPETP